MDIYIFIKSFLIFNKIDLLKYDMNEYVSAFTTIIRKALNKPF